MTNTPVFRKSLAKYYHMWFRDCHDSAMYCEKNGEHQLAERYLDDAKKYFDIIINNWNAVEFFSIDDNAFKHDWALPEEFKGYK